ncbi:NAD-P-binding protein [Mycena metata]|uniref:NAD-P-binding protein n=1 Tax=Mycena metata TaxID=1033252 RepID=A0AAD7IYC6_9AGAR|nr:NAD-P-binding protein [Mycena metata]
MSRGVVLITGINGFLGTYTALTFLEAGYTVRGTGRTAEKAQDWIAHFPAHKAAYQSAVVADLGAPGAFDDAVKGCDIIVHVASPNAPGTDISDTKTEILIPAIHGTRNLLESAKLEPRIRRVVFTGTLAAVLDSSHVEPGKVYTEEDWHPATYDEAKASSNRRYEEKPGWAGATILPCGVFDPPIQPLSSLAAVNRSVGFLWDIVRGEHKTGLEMRASHGMYISARDVAQAHLRAAEREEAKNQRYLLTGGTFGLADLADIIQRHFPALSANLPPSPGTPPVALMFETAKLERDLAMQFMPLETVIVDTVAALLALEKRELGQDASV